MTHDHLKMLQCGCPAIRKLRKIRPSLFGNELNQGNGFSHAIESGLSMSKSRSSDGLGKMTTFLLTSPAFSRKLCHIIYMLYKTMNTCLELMLVQTFWSDLSKKCFSTNVDEPPYTGPGMRSLSCRETCVRIGNI